MEYRINPKTGDKVSVIGLGTSYISEATERDAVEALELAYESGINYADLATAGDKTFGYYGKALSSVRKNMYYPDSVSSLFMLKLCVSFLIIHTLLRRL